MQNDIFDFFYSDFFWDYGFYLLCIFDLLIHTISLIIYKANLRRKIGQDLSDFSDEELQNLYTRYDCASRNYWGEYLFGFSRRNLTFYSESERIEDELYRRSKRRRGN